MAKRVSPTSIEDFTPFLHFSQRLEALEQRPTQMVTLPASTEVNTINQELLNSCVAQCQAIVQGMADRLQGHPIWSLYPNFVSKEFLQQQLQVVLAQRPIEASIGQHEVRNLMELQKSNKQVIDQQNKLIVDLQKRIEALEGQQVEQGLFQRRIVALEGQMREQRTLLQNNHQFIANKLIPSQNNLITQVAKLLASSPSSKGDFF